jgi:SAM-dependent methyltransferase
LVSLEGKSRLLDLGAGTGIHALFFKNAGLDVVCMDFSAGLIKACLAKGLEAVEKDVRALDFESEFDAVFALNSLLHIAPGDLPGVLERICNALRPNGLFYWGQYGGISHQGALERDHYDPKRYFSLLTDDEMCNTGRKVLHAVSFETIEVSRDWEQHFQSSIWRKV